MTSQQTGVAFTIGHSTHTSDEFIALLRRVGISAIADVRSSPYSRYQPHFNRETLQSALREAGIHYVFLGRELGARSEDSSNYKDSKVQYERLAKSPTFQEGLARVQQGSRKYQIALMCAEREPLECHRALLIARELERAGTPVFHIHADGRVESHAEAEQRLLTLAGISGTDLFMSPAEAMAAAYTKVESRIAYVRDSETTKG